VQTWLQKKKKEKKKRKEKKILHIRGQIIHNPDLISYNAVAILKIINGFARIINIEKPVTKHPHICLLALCEDKKRLHQNFIMARTKPSVRKPARMQLATRFPVRQPRSSDEESSEPSSASSRSSSSASGGGKTNLASPYVTRVKDKEYRDIEDMLHGGMRDLAAELRASIVKNERDCYALSTILEAEGRRLEWIDCKYRGRLLSSLVKRVNNEEAELLLPRDVREVSRRMFDFVIRFHENTN
jgi:hypothetical protein